MDQESTVYDLEIRVRDAKLQLDDEDVLGLVNEQKLSADERRVVALLKEDAVEVAESSFRDGRDRVYRFTTEDAVIATTYGFENTPAKADVYATYVSFGLPGFNVSTDDTKALVQDLEAHKAEAARMLQLLAHPGVKMAYADYDKHYGGSMSYQFETTDEAVAREFEFEFIQGEDGDEEMVWAAVQS